MASHEVICSVLGYLTTHKWGTPRRKIEIVRRSGVRKDKRGEAKEAVDELRKDAPFIKSTDHGICIDTSSSSYYQLAEYLYHECGWPPGEIDDRIKHYEGIDQHDWYEE